ncbi:hypothetical protein BE61_19880 [Bradyrhizobium elkanii USDA 61]|nr:hypothetical protein BE61_19880 [Bradyrhizobium elkanii USDA 61]
MTSEFAKCINGSGCHIPRISARLNASNTNLRVPAAGPVDEQNRLIGVLIEIANNLSDHDVNQPLLSACVRGRCIGAQLLGPPLKLGNPLQCAIPARLVSPIALEAVRRLDALFEIERAINGCGADERRVVRQEKSRPLLDDVHA